jgi:hypothetical protein
MRISIVAVLLFFIACKSNNIIPVNTMKVMVWDMACADELVLEKQAKDSTLKKSNLDSLRKTIYQQVFQVHKTTQATFYTNYQYYQQRPDLFKILMDSVQNYGTRESAKPITVKPLTNPIP